MKRLQLLRWSGSVLSPRIRPCRPAVLNGHIHAFVRRQYSAASAAQLDPIEPIEPDEPILRALPPSPPPRAALKSSRLAALHARLALPSRIPLQTLARTLVDPSADPSPQFNNRALTILGTDLLSYYTAEFILCTYPRLPISVVWSAMHAYIGERTLAAITKEWGVEFAVEPGCEVDPGLLQFKRLPPGAKPPVDENEAQPGRRRGSSARTVTDNALGESADSDRFSSEGVTASRASANFVRALIGALYLHGGRPATSKFFKEHFMSRELAVGDLFSFSEPARDLSRLCAREGFQQPIARILSETGRLTRHPVFNVGVFSGKDKLGEGSGSSLPEARFRAAAAALKAWYLYKPLRVRVPSSMEDQGARPWEPVYIDPGEVIV